MVNCFLCCICPVCNAEQPWFVNRPAEIQLPSQLPLEDKSTFKRWALPHARINELDMQCRHCCASFMRYSKLDEIISQVLQRLRGCSKQRGWRTENSTDQTTTSIFRTDLSCPWGRTCHTLDGSAQACKLGFSGTPPRQPTAGSGHQRSGIRPTWLVAGPS